MVFISARTSAAASERSAGWRDRAAITVSASTRTGESPDRLTSLAARVSAAATSGPTASGSIDTERLMFEMPKWTCRRSSRCASPAAAAVAASGAWISMKRQKVEEGAFAEHVEEQRGGGEVVLVEQGAQGQL